MIDKNRRNRLREVHAPIVDRTEADELSNKIKQALTEKKVKPSMTNRNNYASSSLDAAAVRERARLNKTMRELCCANHKKITFDVDSALSWVASEDWTTSQRNRMMSGKLEPMLTRVARELEDGMYSTPSGRSNLVEIAEACPYALKWVRGKQFTACWVHGVFDAADVLRLAQTCFVVPLNDRLLLAKHQLTDACKILGVTPAYTGE